MPLRVPPPEVPVIKWLSPNKADQGLIEFWNTEVASYVPLDVGAAHPNTRDYAGFTLGKQAPVQGDERWVMRIWVTPETSPEWFNYALKYSDEDTDYPIFIRTYRILKSIYAPRAKGSTLGAFYKLVLDDVGSGFANSTLPPATFDTDSDTPAIAHGVPNANGTLSECVLDFCGNGYTGNVTFRVDAPANGNPASGTAYVQPITAILVKEEASLYPEDSEFYAQYFQVTRIYETLPGPVSTSTEFESDGVKKVASKKRIQTGTGTTSEVLSGGGTILTRNFVQEIDSAVSVQITEVITVDSNSLLDKPAFTVSIPEGIIPLEFRANITTTIEAHILPGQATQPTLAAGEFEKSRRQLHPLYYEERTTKLSNLSFPIVQHGQEDSSEYGGSVLDVTRTLDSSALTADSGENVVSSVMNPIGQSLMWFKETKTRASGDVAWPTLTEYDQDPETQSLITTTYKVVDASTVVAPSIVNGVITRYKRIDRWRSIKIVETYSLPADYEEQRFAAQNFPSLWDYTTYNYSTACGPTGPIRQGFSTMVQARLAIHFSTSKQTITGLTLIPNTIHLVHDVIPAVLNDAGTITYVGTCSGPITFPASSPTRSTYVGSIQGTEQLITGESVLWRAGLYKNSRLYVTML